MATKSVKVCDLCGQDSQYSVQELERDGKLILDTGDYCLKCMRDRFPELAQERVVEKLVEVEKIVYRDAPSYSSSSSGSRGFRPSGRPFLVGNRLIQAAISPITSNAWS